MKEYDFLNDLNEKQKYVCVSEDNFILTACPGSGKTRTLTYRLAFLCKKFAGSKLLNIAITYTNRAAEEIEERLTGLNIETSSIWTGTIHSFCLNYIMMLGSNKRSSTIQILSTLKISHIKCF